MAAGDTCVADLVDTVHHEMDSTARSHHFYKSVQSSVIGDQLVLEKEPAGNRHDDFVVCGSVKGQFSDSWLHSITDSQIMWYYT